MKLTLVDQPATQADRGALEYARAVTHALIRLEWREEVKPRLTEAELATWNRFRGRLSTRHLFELLREDASVIYPYPFDVARVLREDAKGLRALSDEQVETWAREAQATTDRTEGADHLLDRGRDLGLPTRMAKSDLHKLKPHYKVLELPGTGGLLSHYLLSRQQDDGLFLEGAFHIACATWQELTLAGLVAVELKATGELDAVRDVRGDTKLESLREPQGDRDPWRYDVVVGLGPERGGAYAADALKRWFPNADLQLL